MPCPVWEGQRHHDGLKIRPVSPIDGLRDLKAPHLGDTSIANGTGGDAATCHQSAVEGGAVLHGLQDSNRTTGRGVLALADAVKVLWMLKAFGPPDREEKAARDRLEIVAGGSGLAHPCPLCGGGERTSRTYRAPPRWGLSGWRGGWLELEAIGPSGGKVAGDFVSSTKAP